MDFSYLIAPQTSADFLARYWQKSPLLIRGNRDDRFQSLIVAKDLDALLSWLEQLPAAAVDLVGRRRAGAPDSESSGKLSEFFSQGSTIRAKGLEQHQPPLQDLCDTIHQEFGSPTRANLYCTPANARGFDLHFDTHEVLVLQLFGRKRWQVYEPILQLPLEQVPPLQFETDPESVRRSRGGAGVGQNQIKPEELGSALLDVILEPGDCLYLPRGFVHQAESMEEASVHLTIGIHVHTWLDVFTVALGQAAYRNQSLREALPPGSFNDPKIRENLSEGFAQRLRSFTDDAQFERAVAELAASFSRSLGARTKPVLPDSINQTTRLATNGQLQVYVSADGTMTGLARGQNIFWMPACFAPAIRFIAEHDSFSASELPGQITEKGKLTFVGRLIADGFLRIAD